MKGQRGYSMTSESGMSLVELMVVVAVSSLLIASGVSNLKELESPLNDASFATVHYLKLARATAISRTKAVVVTRSSSSRLTSAEADNCASSQTDIDSLILDLPGGATFTSSGWTICFTQRGFAESAVSFPITAGSDSKTIQIALGGGIREL